ncbi:MAG: FAD-dependent oxidoreductase, partial [Candidatus Kariarchaeaceae archaeon]
MSGYDVIIVGAGLGGLAAGAKLSRGGKKVLLVEQHNVVGGCSTIFKRKRKMTFEVGLHEMSALARESRIQMFKEFGIYDLVDFVRVPEFYRIQRGEFDIVIPDDAEEAKDILIKRFPEEKTAITTYFKDIIDIRMQSYRIRWRKSKKIIFGPVFLYLIAKLIKYRKTTVGEYLDQLTANEELKLAIIANLGYYHDDPYSLSFLYFALGQTSYLQGGGWFVKGGSQNLSDAFAKVITDNGGEIILKHLVTEIIVKNNMAIGIKYIRKNRPHAEEKESYGSNIIANASMLSVVNSLIPSLNGKDVQTTINNLDIACSLSTIYFSFKEPISKFFENRYSTFFYSPELKSLKDFTKIEKSHDYSKKGFVFVDYNAIDSGLHNEGSYIASLCLIDYLDNWEPLPKEEYKRKKEEVIQIFKNRLEEKFPGLTDLIDYSEMSTPKTIKRYTLNEYGTVYGFAQTPKQALKFKSKHFDIENLYFASAWELTGGFGSAITSGYLSAMKTMNKEVRMIRYPRDGHELSRSGEPLHVIDRLERMIKWFDS